jgi:hypothetical protein
MNAARKKAKSQAARLLSIVRKRAAKSAALDDGMISITDAAKEIGVPRYRIATLADTGKVQAPFRWFTKRGRTYKARVVDVDACRVALEKKETWKRKRRERAKKRGNFEKPPPGVTALRDVSRATAINHNTLLAWVHKRELISKKYVTHRPGIRCGWEWYVVLDDVIALFKKKRAERSRNNFKRVESLQVTPAIRELWEIDAPAYLSDTAVDILADVGSHPMTTTKECAQRTNFCRHTVAYHLKRSLSDRVRKVRIGRRVYLEVEVGQ